MASVYKLPIALQLLRRVERGELKLNDTVKLSEHDFRPGVSPVIKEAKGKPLTLNIGRLLDLMLRMSDNTASDILMRQAGGPEAVTARLRELGVTGIDVNRSEAQMALDFWGVRQPPPESEWTLALFDKLKAEVKSAESEAAAALYVNDPRDTSTPDAMTELLIKLQRGEALGAEGTERLLQIMKASPTGPARLKGLLPKGTVVAHKTGTIGSMTNDVGIITLPGDDGHIAIAVFVKGSTKSVEERERAIAEIARAIYDDFIAQTAKTR
jgi:beta-lactamase class A